jgi:hypothetical protein
MTSIVENWTDLMGEIRNAQGPAADFKSTKIEVLVQATRPVGAYPSLLDAPIGGKVTVLCKAEALSAQVATAGRLIVARVRRGRNAREAFAHTRNLWILDDEAGALERFSTLEKA